MALANIKQAQISEGIDLSEDRLADLLNSPGTLTAPDFASEGNHKPRLSDHDVDLSDQNDFRVHSDGEIEELLTPEQLGIEEDEVVSDIPQMNIISINDDDYPETQDHIDFDFELERYPGAEDQEDLEDEEEADPLDNFMEHIQEKFKNVPRHTGKHILGIEKAINHLQDVSKEISEAFQSDTENKLDTDTLEKARDNALMAIDRLEERKTKLENKKFPNRKKKKKATPEEAQIIVKQAFQKLSSVGFGGGVTVTVPLFIHNLAGALINSAVSAGRDIDYEFQKMAEEQKLTTREQTELRALLEHMGQPVRMDRGYNVGEPVDMASADNLEWVQNWPS